MTGEPARCCLVGMFIGCHIDFFHETFTLFSAITLQEASLLENGLLSANINTLNLLCINFIIL